MRNFINDCKYIHIVFFIKKWARRNYPKSLFWETQRNIVSKNRVGKTSLLNSYVDQKFVNSYKATVGADFMEKEVVVDGKVINLEVLPLLYRYGTLQDRKNLGA